MLVMTADAATATPTLTSTKRSRALVRTIVSDRASSPKTARMPIRIAPTQPRPA